MKVHVLSHEGYDLPQGKVRESFWVLLFLKFLQFKIVNIPKAPYFGIVCSEPHQLLSPSSINFTILHMVLYSPHSMAQLPYKIWKYIYVIKSATKDKIRNTCHTQALFGLLP